MNSYSKNDLMSSAKVIQSYPNQAQPAGGGGGSRVNGGGGANNKSKLPTKPDGSVGGVPSRGSANLGQPTGSISSGGSSAPNRAGGGGPSYPSAGSRIPGSQPAGGGIGPNRGANGGGTVYVNSLGQLSTDTNSGFDPKKSFIVRPDQDSTAFDQDINIPSNSFDAIKGIGNSYSFGFPTDANVPLRGSADLSEPVDPSEVYGNDQYSNPGLNRKQIYTYPHDIQAQIPNVQPILPELIGQINTKLNAQSPKYPTPQVYGPVATPPQLTAPQTLYQQPSVPSSNSKPAQYGQQNSYQQPSAELGLVPYSGSQPQGQLPAQYGTQNSYQQGQGSPGGQAQTAPIKLYQQPHKNVPAVSAPTSQNQPLRQYSQPSAPQTGLPQPFRASQVFPEPSSQPQVSQQEYAKPQAPQQAYTQPQAPQQAYSQPQAPQQAYLQPQAPQQAYSQPQAPQQAYSQPQAPQQAYSQPKAPQQAYLQPQAPQQAYSQPQRTQQVSSQPQRAQTSNSQSQQSQPSYSQPQRSQQPNQNYGQPQQASQPQPFRPQSQQASRRNDVHQSNHASSQSNGGSNEGFLHQLLQKKGPLHSDKNQFIDLIQRLFGGQRVVSADVHQSKPKESYSFTYDDQGAPSNYQQRIASNNNRQNYNQQPSFHQHSGTCGHNQAY